MKITQIEGEQAVMAVQGKQSIIIGVLPPGIQQIEADVDRELILVFEDGTIFRRLLTDREWEVFAYLRMY